MIINCSCKSEFQDAKYGINRRVGIPKGPSKDEGSKGQACSVCGVLHTEYAFSGKAKVKATAAEADKIASEKGKK